MKSLIGIKLLVENTRRGLRYKRWSYSEAWFFLLKGLAWEFYCSFKKRYDMAVSKHLKRWLKQEEESYFDFKGVKLPDVSNSPEHLYTLALIFEDVLMFHCYFNDDYNRVYIE